jgi:hypothetical protein
LSLLCGNTTFRSILVKPFYIPNESTIKTDPLDLPDRNNQNPESEDFIVINTLPTVKRNKGRLYKYADVTLFLQNDADYKTSR